MVDSIKSGVSKFIRDRHGKVAVWQTPNVPLVGWLSCLVIVHLVPSGSFKSGISSLGTAFLFTWAYMEITGGASYFRRVLGSVVLVSVLVGFFL